MSDSTSLALLAALYHESVRAYSQGQGRPFTEWPDLRDEAHEGRIVTAQALLERFDFTLRARGLSAALLRDQVEHLAPAIHECEREAVESGLVAVVLDPTRPWIPFAELPEPAQEGRRQQARFLLARFYVHPRSAKAPPTFSEVCLTTARTVMQSGLDRDSAPLLAEAREWFKLSGET